MPKPTSDDRSDNGSRVSPKQPGHASSLPSRHAAVCCSKPLLAEMPTAATCDPGPEMAETCPAEVQCPGPVCRPNDRRLSELAHELTGLAAHINAATCRFLLLLEEFDRLGGWQQDGLVSCAHWLNWRCGIGLHAAREKVRVARGLPELPLIRDCFETGELSYSKVRAMTRIATPDNEEVLLQVARYGTAHHVETMVSKWRDAKRSEDLIRAGRQHTARSFTYHHDEDGCLVIRARLPAEQGAVVLAALQAAVDQLEGQEGGEQTGGDVPAGTCCAVGHEPETQQGGPKGDSHAGCGQQQSAVGNTADSTAWAAPVRSHAGHVPAGTPRCGYSELRDDAHLTAATSFDTDESRPNVTQRRADALVFLIESWLGGRSGKRSAADRYLVNVHIDAETLGNGGLGRSELEDGPALAAETVRRLGCDAPFVASIDDEDGNPLNIGRKSRAIPPAIRRALGNRDSGCRFPGCTRTRWLDGHHITHWADGGETSLDNLVSLCRHHHRLVHEGGFGVHVDNDRQIRFTTPAGATIPISPPGRSLDTPLQIEIETFQRKRGISSDYLAAGGGWDGSRMDYDYVGMLLGQAEPPPASDRRPGFET